VVQLPGVSEKLEPDRCLHDLRASRIGNIAVRAGSRRSIGSLDGPRDPVLDHAAQIRQNPRTTCTLYARSESPGLCVTLAWAERITVLFVRARVESTALLVSGPAPRDDSERGIRYRSSCGLLDDC